MHVIVIGAGLSGTLTALELVKDPDVEVTLLEMAEEILPDTSTSANASNKLHSGLHFGMDIYTAINCLQKSIDFARAFPEFVSGKDTPHAPWRRGRYYVMSNSLVSVTHVRELADTIHQLYTRLVAEDPANKVFGEPEDFIRYLAAPEYANLSDSIPFYNEAGEVESISVACAIETGESQLDILSLKAALKEAIEKHPRISLCTGSEVLSIDQSQRTANYHVLARHMTTKVRSIYSGFAVINCAWQNIEKLNSTAGIVASDQHRVNRLKASILVRLPDELRGMNSSTFSLGPYASMTIIPDGTAILTSERTTNIASFQAGPKDDFSEEMCTLVESLTLSTSSGQDVAHKILDECASYLNAELSEKLRSAEITSLRLGFVKLIGNASAYTKSCIYQAASMIHTRALDGIEIHRPGYISNAGMKMIYTLSNAQQVSEIITNYMSEITAQHCEEKSALVQSKSESSFRAIVAGQNQIKHSLSLSSLGMFRGSPVAFFVGSCPSMGEETPLRCHK